MDDKKIHSVVNWLQPTTLKELQCFLGFANFYRRFIRNFSTVAAPLTSMTKKGNQRLTWSPPVHQAFRTLKERFTILHHPNPEQEFIVEVDASSTGIGAVQGSRLVQGSLLFVTYTIIQGIISSEMLVRTGPLNGKCKKKKNIIIK